MNSIEEIENIPVTPGGGHGPYLRDMAQVGLGTAPGQYDRYNQQRMITITSQHLRAGSRRRGPRSRRRPFAAPEKPRAA